MRRPAKNPCDLAYCLVRVVEMFEDPPLKRPHQRFVCETAFPAASVGFRIVHILLRKLQM